MLESKDSKLSIIFSPTMLKLTYYFFVHIETYKNTLSCMEFQKIITQIMQHISVRHSICSIHPRSKHYVTFLSQYNH